MPSKQLLICDLDNTLYDWVSYFVPSFYAMVDATVEITGCDREKLLDDFRAVHQKYGDSEHPFALLETETIKNLYRHASTGSMLAALDPAFHAFNSARKKNLHLHSGVRETLETLRGSGIKLIAHTESKLYGVADRLNGSISFGILTKCIAANDLFLRILIPTVGRNGSNEFRVTKSSNYRTTKRNPIRQCFWRFATTKELLGRRRRMLGIALHAIF
jgi:hypothetical protein